MQPFIVSDNLFVRRVHVRENGVAAADRTVDHAQIPNVGGCESQLTSVWYSSWNGG